MWIFKLFAIVMIGFFNLQAHAQEPAVPATSNITFSGRQDDSWQHMQTELGNMKLRLDAQEAIVTELLLNKRNNKGRLSKDQIDQLSINHKKLTDLNKEYDQKLSEFELRYPEIGQSAGRQYVRKKISSLEEMEKSLTLDGRIKKINKKIKSQYSSSENREPKPKKVLKTDAENKQETKPVKPLNDVTDKIIIVK